MIRATKLAVVVASALAALLATGALKAAVAPLPQGKSQEELARLRDEKKAHAVFAKAAWTFDYDEARARAAKEDKLIFAYFTRSYKG